MFIAYVYYHKNGAKKRKVEPLFNDKFVLNLITNRMSDEEVNALQDGVWLFDTERELKDKNGNPFRICKPVRFLCETNEFFRMYNVREVLVSAFSRDAETEDQCSETQMETMLSRRISHRTGHGKEGIWKWVREQVESGAVSFETIDQWVSAPIPVDWNHAKLIPAEDYIRSGEIGTVFRFRDLNSGEDETLDIRAYNLDDFRSVIPGFVQICKKGQRQLTLEILMDKVFAIAYDKSDPVYGNALAALQQTGALWVKVTPYVDRPDIRLDVGVGKTSVNFQRTLKGYGIKELNGQYVPEETPDWKLTKIDGYRLENDAYEITSPTTCMVNAEFSNGMTGRYPLIYMMKRYPGECINARFTVKGYSLDSLRATVTLSNKR